MPQLFLWAFFTSLVSTFRLVLEFSLFPTVFCRSKRKQAVCFSSTASFIFPFQIFKRLSHINSLCPPRASTEACTVHLLHFPTPHQPFQLVMITGVGVTVSCSNLPIAGTSGTFSPLSLNTNFVIKSLLHILIKLLSLLRL